MGRVVALRDASDLARSRYDSGLANYIEILTADQSCFSRSCCSHRRTARSCGRAPNSIAPSAADGNRDERTQPMAKMKQKKF